MEKLIHSTVQETGIEKKQVQQVISLIQEGNTVPFIARYRKEQTGGLDELQIKEINDTYEYAKNVHQRQEEVLRLIDEQGKLTDELRVKIYSSKKLQQLEDLYRPYKQKRRTRATIAKERGLEPLAKLILSFPNTFNQSQELSPYVNEENDLNNVEEVLAGACDIIAEGVAEDPIIRERLREKAMKQSTVESVKKARAEDEKSVFAIYYEFAEPIGKMVPHRTLALNRGEKEQILRVNVRFQSDVFIDQIKRYYIKKHGSPVVPIVEQAIEDAFSRLLEPSLEREVGLFLQKKQKNKRLLFFQRT